MHKTLYRLINPIIDIKKLANIFKYPQFLYQCLKLKKINDLYPCLEENIENEKFDNHYLFQDLWAFDEISKLKTKKHLDVSSSLPTILLLSTIKKVTYIEFRPPNLKNKIKNFKFLKGDILNLPIKNDSIKSLSSLHVLEHIGLGRYGDEIDLDGTKKACKELSRILSKNGHLFVSVPIGVPKLCFNAHRIHNPADFRFFFNNLKLVEYSYINDEGILIRNSSLIHELPQYGCGLFHFTKI